MLTQVVLFSLFAVFTAAVWVDEMKLIADCLRKERNRNNSCREKNGIMLVLCS